MLIYLTYSNIPFILFYFFNHHLAKPVKRLRIEQIWNSEHSFFLVVLHHSLLIVHPSGEQCLITLFFFFKLCRYAKLRTLVWQNIKLSFILENPRSNRAVLCCCLLYQDTTCQMPSVQEQQTWFLVLGSTFLSEPSNCFSYLHLCVYVFLVWMFLTTKYALFWMSPKVCLLGGSENLIYTFAVFLKEGIPYFNPGCGLRKDKAVLTSL